MKKCNNCGFENQDSNIFCNKCGNKLEENNIDNKYCPKCGLQINPGNSFCTGCGTPIDQNNLNVSDMNQSSNDSPLSYENLKRNNEIAYQKSVKVEKKFLPVTIIIGIIMLVIGIILSFVLESFTVFLGIIPIVIGLAYSTIKDRLMTKANYKVIKYVNEKFKDR